MNAAYNTLPDIKQNDPIWKRMRLELIYVVVWLLLFFVYIIFFISTSLQNTGVSSAILIFLFYSLSVFGRAFNYMRWRRYWRRIGERRKQALSASQPFMALSQPAPDREDLALPVTLKLQRSRLLTSIFVTFFFLFIISGVILLVVLLTHPQDGESIAIFLPLIIGILVIFFLAMYLFASLYLTQKIELTEEGFKTTYLRQERFIRWNEARTFARYGAQGIQKSSMVQTYELANENTVVRWSQLPAISFALSVESSIGKKEDWNWLIGRVNAVVKARTELPLLNLGDDQLGTVSKVSEKSRSARSVSKGGAMQENAGQLAAAVSSEEDIPIALDDPARKSLQLRGSTRNVFVFLGFVSLLLIALGVYFRISIPRQDILVVFGKVMLILGGIMGVFTLLLLLLIVWGNHYYKRLAALRQQGLRYTDAFLADEQPQKRNIIPQPSSLRMYIDPWYSWRYQFVSSIVVCCVIGVFLLPDATSFRNVLIFIGGTLVFSLLTSFLQAPTRRRTSEKRISVSEKGITVYNARAEHYMDWADAKLFTVIHKKKLFSRTLGNVQTCELASEKSVVRWPAADRLKHQRTDPAMTVQEYEQWLEQLNGYIVEKTDLPLLDLEGKAQNK